VCVTSYFHIHAEGTADTVYIFIKGISIPSDGLHVSNTWRHSWPRHSVTLQVPVSLHVADTQSVKTLVHVLFLLTSDVEVALSDTNPIKKNSDQRWSNAKQLMCALRLLKSAASTVSQLGIQQRDDTGREYRPNTCVLLTHLKREVPCSNLGPETWKSDWGL